MDEIVLYVVLPYLMDHPGLTFLQNNARLHMAPLPMNCLQTFRTLPFYVGHLISPSKGIFERFDGKDICNHSAIQPELGDEEYDKLKYWSWHSVTNRSEYVVAEGEIINSSEYNNLTELLKVDVCNFE
ncbi:hypothetical protein NPIL_69131 [Nephila pilipes]|uniref:Uncharacterized protein n=1 Tax=Nephila pilipes TaxID=299642 RepID=A0A8X6NSV0_NEPPI|nr:hypothetical protein NPIL_69131 [Nephila pilipes]